MRVSLWKFVPVALVCMSLSGFASTDQHKSAKSNHTTSHKASAPKPAGMDSERATQIQSALIKQGYLTGEPTGTWDAASVAAMQKLQGENGWQTKFTPDARALIKLGLGGGGDAGAPAGDTVASAAQ